MTEALITLSFSFSDEPTSMDDHIRVSYHRQSGSIRPKSMIAKIEKFVTVTSLVPSFPPRYSQIPEI